MCFFVMSFYISIKVYLVLVIVLLLQLILFQFSFKFSSNNYLSFISFNKTFFLIVLVLVHNNNTAANWINVNIWFINLLSFK